MKLLGFRWASDKLRFAPSAGRGLKLLKITLDNLHTASFAPSAGRGLKRVE